MAVVNLIAQILHPLDEDRAETFDIEAELAARRPVVTKPGELLELGEHRLLCGDSTKAEDARRVMNGYRTGLFATDPPYLVGYDGTNHPGKTCEKRREKQKNKDWSDSYGVSWDDADAILRDEAGHIAFHCDRHASQGSMHGSRYGRLWEICFRLLGLAAATMLWVNHARAIRALGGSGGEFYGEVWRELSRFIRRLRRDIQIEINPTEPRGIVALTSNTQTQS